MENIEKLRKEFKKILVTSKRYDLIHENVNIDYKLKNVLKGMKIIGLKKSLSDKKRSVLPAIVNVSFILGSLLILSTIGAEVYEKVKEKMGLDLEKHNNKSIPSVSIDVSENDNNAKLPNDLAKTLLAISALFATVLYLLNFKKYINRTFKISNIENVFIKKIQNEKIKISEKSFIIATINKVKVVTKDGKTFDIEIIVPTHMNIDNVVVVFNKLLRESKATAETFKDVLKMYDEMIKTLEKYGKTKDIETAKRLLTEYKQNVIILAKRIKELM